jgi:hypothetical protein
MNAQLSIPLPSHLLVNRPYLIPSKGCSLSFFTLTTHYVHHSFVALLFILLGEWNNEEVFICNQQEIGSDIRIRRKTTTPSIFPFSHREEGNEDKVLSLI